MSSSTPSICVVVVFSRTNHRSGSGSGALRSPSHKKITGSMLPPFPYLPLPSTPPYLPSPHPLVSSFLLTSATWTPNLDPFSPGWRLTLSQVFVRYSRFPEIQTLLCLKTSWPPLGFFPTSPLSPLLLFLPSYPLASSATHLSLALASPSSVQAPKLSLTLSYARP